MQEHLHACLSGDKHPFDFSTVWLGSADIPRHRTVNHSFYLFQKFVIPSSNRTMTFISGISFSRTAPSSLTKNFGHPLSITMARSRLEKDVDKSAKKEKKSSDGKVTKHDRNDKKSKKAEGSAVRRQSRLIPQATTRAQRLALKALKQAQEIALALRPHPLYSG